MAQENKHTPLPWQLADDDKLIVVTQALNKHENCWIVADTLQGRIGSCRIADAEFITRACNSHYELVEALHLAKKLIKQSGMAAGSAHTVIDAALARSTGKEDK